MIVGIYTHISRFVFRKKRADQSNFKATIELKFSKYYPVATIICSTRTFDFKSIITVDDDFIVQL